MSSPNATSATPPISTTVIPAVKGNYKEELKSKIVTTEAAASINIPKETDQTEEDVSRLSYMNTVLLPQIEKIHDIEERKEKKITDPKSIIEERKSFKERFAWLRLSLKDKSADLDKSKILEKSHSSPNLSTETETSISKAKNNKDSSSLSASARRVRERSSTVSEPPKLNEEKETHQNQRSFPRVFLRSTTSPNLNSMTLQDIINPPDISDKINNGEKKKNTMKKLKGPNTKRASKATNSSSPLITRDDYEKAIKKTSDGLPANKTEPPQRRAEFQSAINLSCSNLKDLRESNNPVRNRSASVSASASPISPRSRSPRSHLSQRINLSPEIRESSPEEQIQVDSDETFVAAVFNLSEKVWKKYADKFKDKLKKIDYKKMYLNTDIMKEVIIEIIKAIPDIKQIDFHAFKKFEESVFATLFRSIFLSKGVEIIAIPEHVALSGTEKRAQRSVTLKSRALRVITTKKEYDEYIKKNNAGISEEELIRLIEKTIEPYPQYPFDSFKPIFNKKNKKIILNNKRLTNCIHPLIISADANIKVFNCGLFDWETSEPTFIKFLKLLLESPINTLKIPKSMISKEIEELIERKIKESKGKFTVIRSTLPEELEPIDQLTIHLDRLSRIFCMSKKNFILNLDSLDIDLKKINFGKEKLELNDDVMEKLIIPFIKEKNIRKIDFTCFDRITCDLSSFFRRVPETQLRTIFFKTNLTQKERYFFSKAQEVLHEYERELSIQEFTEPRERHKKTAVAVLLRRIFNLKKDDFWKIIREGQIDLKMMKCSFQKKCLILDESSFHNVFQPILTHKGQSFTTINLSHFKQQFRDGTFNMVLYSLPRSVNQVIFYGEELDSQKNEIKKTQKFFSTINRELKVRFISKKEYNEEWQKKLIQGKLAEMFGENNEKFMEFVENCSVDHIFNDEKRRVVVDEDVLKNIILPFLNNSQLTHINLSTVNISQTALINLFEKIPNTNLSKIILDGSRRLIEAESQSKAKALFENQKRKLIIEFSQKKFILHLLENVFNMKKEELSSLIERWNIPYELISYHKGKNHFILDKLAMEKVILPIITKSQVNTVNFHFFDRIAKESFVPFFKAIPDTCLRTVIIENIRHLKENEQQALKEAKEAIKKKYQVLEVIRTITPIEAAKQDFVIKELLKIFQVNESDQPNVSIHEQIKEKLLTHLNMHNLDPKAIRYNEPKKCLQINMNGMVHVLVPLLTEFHQITGINLKHEVSEMAMKAFYESIYDTNIDTITIDMNRKQSDAEKKALAIAMELSTKKFRPIRINEK